MNSYFLRVNIFVINVVDQKIAYIYFWQFIVQVCICVETFKIANSRGLMGIFSLIKTSVKIGEDIVGVFSFNEGTVPCVQVITRKLLCMKPEVFDAFTAKMVFDAGNIVPLMSYFVFSVLQTA